MKPAFVACYDKKHNVGCYHEFPEDEPLCQCKCHRRNTKQGKCQT